MRSSLSARCKLAAGDLAEADGRGEFLVVAPMLDAVPVPSHQRPDDGVVGVAGEDQALVDLAGGGHGAPELVGCFEQRAPWAVAAKFGYAARAGLEAGELTI